MTTVASSFAAMLIPRSRTIDPISPICVKCAETINWSPSGVARTSADCVCCCEGPRDANHSEIASAGSVASRTEIAASMRGSGSLVESSARASISPAITASREPAITALSPVAAAIAAGRAEPNEIPSSTGATEAAGRCLKPTPLAASWSPARGTSRRHAAANRSSASSSPTAVTTPRAASADATTSGSIPAAGSSSASRRARVRSCSGSSPRASITRRPRGAASTPSCCSTSSVFANAVASPTTMSVRLIGSASITIPGACFGAPSAAGCERLPRAARSRRLCTTRVMSPRSTRMSRASASAGNASLSSSPTSASSATGRSRAASTHTVRVAASALAKSSRGSRRCGSA